MKCFLKHVIKENIEMTGRRGIRGKQLMNYFKEKKTLSNLKEEALDRTW